MEIIGNIPKYSKDWAKGSPGNGIERFCVPSSEVYAGRPFQNFRLPAHWI